MCPPLLKLPDADAYRKHYLNKYCRGVVTTFDGIRVYFKDTKFGHAFYGSSKRDGDKDTFSVERAERMDWIESALAERTVRLKQGWIKEKERYDPHRRVCIVYGSFVVVIEVSQKRSGARKANFVTAFVGTPGTLQKILSGPDWVP